MVDDYRQLQKLKYEKHRLLKEQEKKEIDEIKRQEDIIEKKLIEEKNIEQNKILFVILEIEEKIDIIQYDSSMESIAYNLELILSLIHSNLELINKCEKLSEIQNMIIHVITIINMVNEKKVNKENLDSIKNISNIIKSIFELINFDIDIEMMDTSGDEEFARKLSNTK